MIDIQVIIINGRLVGRRFQDRWNLAHLGYTHLDHSRNQGGVNGLKKFRRFFGSDFSISIVKGSMEAIRDEERALFAGDTARKAA